jgi:hypothetical protein
MKRTLLALALVAVTGFAYGQNRYEDETLAPITVEHTDAGRILLVCQPPNGAEECANFHELIRENFSPREIGMLFGGSTAYFESPVNYARTHERYVAFVQDLEDNGVPVPTDYRY